MRLLARWYFGFAGFLVVCGLVGFLSNPERALTALLSGLVFGSLFAAWGVLLQQGRAWGRKAGLVTLALLLIAFGWRGVVSWQIVAGGGDYKILASVLITLMFGGALLVAWQSLRLKPKAAHQAGATPGEPAETA